MCDMSTNTSSSDQENVIQIIRSKRQYIENEINKIFKKSPNLKIDAVKKRRIIDFVFDNLPLILGSINKNVDEEEIKTLEIKSINDLKLAELAYQTKDYSNALFHLQQSIEKSVKAYGLYYGIIKESKDEIVHKIGHKSPKVYLKLLRFPWVDDVSNIFTPEINLQKRLADLDSLVKEENKSKILDLDGSVPLFLEMYERVSENIRKSFSRHEVKIITDEVKRNFGVDIKDEYTKQIEFALLLYLFSFITWIYAVDPRYSNEIEYEKLNIIKNFNKIVHLFSPSKLVSETE